MINAKFFRNYTFLMINILFLLYSSYILIFNIKLSFDEVIVYSILYIFLLVIFMFVYKIIFVIPISTFIIFYIAVQTFGLPLAMLIDNDTAISYIMREKLYYGTYLGEYVAISVISLSSIFISFIVFSKRIEEIISERKLNKKNFQLIVDEVNNQKNYYFIIGIVLVSLFSLFMSYNFLIGSIPLNYEDYLVWKENRILNYLQYGFWFGSIFVIATIKKKNVIFFLILFSIPSLILIMSGNRNDVLYPLITGIGIYIYRFNKIPLIPLSLVAFFVAIVSPLISSTRTSGINLVTDSSYRELIASSLNEFGSQVTPVSNMLEWLKHGEEYAYGITYFYGAFVGIFGVFFSDLSLAFASTRYDISERLPALGFSMSAEVYFNFSILGLIVIYFLLGVYWIRRESNLLNVNQLVRYSFVCFSLLFLVRNSFSSYSTVVILFFILYFFEKLLRILLKNFNSSVKEKKVIPKELHNSEH